MPFVSQIEPSKVKEALDDDQWIISIQEELNQFERNKFWDLVPRPKYKHILSTKWIFKNKSDENGIIISNEERLVAQGHNQEGCIDFDKMFSHVARL